MFFISIYAANHFVPTYHIWFYHSCVDENIDIYKIGYYT